MVFRVRLDGGSHHTVSRTGIACRRNVQKQARDSSVGEMRSDARSHSARAEYRGLLNSLFHSLMIGDSDFDERPSYANP